MVFSGFSQDSLAAEIEGTMRKELQLEEPESPDIAYGLVLGFPETGSCPVAIKTNNVWVSDTPPVITVVPPQIWVQIKGDKRTQPMIAPSNSY